MDKKRLIRLILIFALLSSMGIGANGATKIKYDAYADKLATIDVFKGTGSGYELDRQPTRLEGLVMLIRLLGKEDEAKAFKASENAFDDVPAWGQVYTNYAFANKLTNGLGDRKYGSDQVMSGNAFHTFILRALGYDDSKGDFSWNGANDFANSKGIISNDYYMEISNIPFTRDHVAKSSYDALFSLKKDSQETLLNSLVVSGDIDKTKAAGMEMVTKPTTPTTPIPPTTPIVKASGIVISALDKGAEYVSIYNTTDEAINIGGWKMVSLRGEQTFVFPKGYTLGAKKTCKLTSGAIKYTGDFTMALTTIWNNYESDPAILYDNLGNEVSRWND